MKIRRKLTVVGLCILSLLCLLAIPLSKTQAKAQDTEIRYTKRIVSVLLDNSGSMGSEKRYEYALYSMQILMGLLGEGDEMVITPMNNFTYGGKNYGQITVNLNEADRTAEIDRINDILTDHAKGTTPHKPIDNCIQTLTDAGMQTKDNLLKEPTNCDFWLVVLTDGEFDQKDKNDRPFPDKKRADAIIEDYIKIYPSLNTIYLGLGSDADDLSGSYLQDTCKFSPYRAATSDGIVEVMQKVASQMSGRYEIEPSKYTVSGNKITLDLANVPFALNNITVVAQNFIPEDVVNCTQVIPSVTLNGQTMQVQHPSLYIPAGNLGLKNGFSGVVEGNPYLQEGVIEITFPYELKQVSILAEPALSMKMTIERQTNSGWVATDAQYINANMTPGQKIRVNYQVFEQSSQTEIKVNEIGELFNIDFKVVYAGGSYSVSQDIKLVKGINELSGSLSLFSGKYTLYDSFTCVVEDNPTDYRIERVGTPTLDETGKKVSATYTVYYDGSPLSQTGLQDFEVEVAMSDTDGKDLGATYTVSPDGKLNVTANVSKIQYGVYQDYVKVTSVERIYREYRGEIPNYPTAVALTVSEGEDLSLTHYQFSTNESEYIQFTLTADGKPINFESGLFDYKLTFCGVDVTDKVILEGNKLNYTPKADDVSQNATGIGEKELILSVKGKGGTVPEVVKQSKIQVTNTVYVVKTIASNKNKLDKFEIEESAAVVYFAIYHDDIALTEEELQRALDSGEIEISDSGVFSSYFWLPCGYEIKVETVSGTPVVAYHIVDDWIPVLNTFASILIVAGDKEVSLSYEGSTAINIVTVESGGIWGHIWRTLVNLLIIHLILFTIGFATAKCLTPGIWVKISLGRDSDEASISTTKVNLTFKTKWLWHWKRLVFYKKHYFSRQDSTPRIQGLVTQYFDGKIEKVKFREDVRESTLIDSGRLSRSSVGANFESFRSGLRKQGKKCKSRPKIEPTEEFTGEFVRRIYRSNGQFINKNEARKHGARDYAILDAESQAITTIIFFVRTL